MPSDDHSDPGAEPQVSGPRAQDGEPLRLRSWEERARRAEARAAEAEAALLHFRECADTPLMRDVLAQRDAARARAERAEAERDAARTVIRGVLTVCRECRDEMPLFATNVPPADFIIWGKLAGPEALGPRCYDHAVKHLGSSLPHRADQYAVVDLRTLRAALVTPVEVAEINAATRQPQGTE